MTPTRRMVTIRDFIETERLLLWAKALLLDEVADFDSEHRLFLEEMERYEILSKELERQ